MSLKFRTLVSAIFFALLIFFCHIPNADAATLLINGQGVQSEEYTIRDGITMVSEDFVKNDMHFSVDRKNRQVDLEAPNHLFKISCEIGKKAYFIDNHEGSFNANVMEKNGKIYFPLRTLIENFGVVQWDKDSEAVQTCYDYNKYIKLPLVKMENQTKAYKIIRDAGIQSSRERTYIRQEERETIFEEKDEQGHVVRVYSNSRTLIKPVHKDYVLNDVYGIDKENLYWIEYPKNDQANKWYLYSKGREATEAICIDNGSYKQLKQMPFGTEIFNNISFNQGDIAYLYGTEDKNLEVRWYSPATKKVKVLDKLSIDKYPLGTFQIALGDNDVFWTKIYGNGRYSQYGTLYRYSKLDGASQSFYAGCNLLGPEICGDYLIVRNKPFGENFTQINNRMISGEIWIYSLKLNKWLYKIDNTLPLSDEEYIVTHPVKLDSNHITFNVEGIEKYALPIVDLRTGKVNFAKNHEGKILYYSPVEKTDGIVFELSKMEEDHDFLAKILNDKNETVIPLQIDLEGKGL